MASELGEGVTAQMEFSRALTSLKQGGSNILLVGSQATSAHRVACERLLGEADSDARYRLVVKTTSDSLCQCQTDSKKIDYEALCQEQTDTTAEDTLGQLSVTLNETIDEFESDADGLDPSAFRLCVTSLVPLLQASSAEQVFRLLHVATTRVRQVNGMGHFHLPLERDHDAVHLYEPLFDAVVEVRSRDDVDEQCWHLRDHRDQSGWIPF